MPRTITRADLSESMFQNVGLSRNDSANLLEMVLDEISNCLANGESVKLSSFGSFTVRQKSERIGRNPKTGVEVPISPRKVLIFRPSQLLKDRVKGGGSLHNLERAEEESSFQEIHKSYNDDNDRESFS